MDLTLAVNKKTPTRTSPMRVLKAALVPGAYYLVACFLVKVFDCFDHELRQLNVKEDITIGKRLDTFFSRQDSFAQITQRAAMTSGATWIYHPGVTYLVIDHWAELFLYPVKRATVTSTRSSVIPDFISIKHRP